MSSIDHHHRDTERRLEAALEALAETVGDHDLAPSRAAAPVAPPRLLRTRGGAAALAVTALVSGAAGAAAAAIPGDEAPPAAPGESSADPLPGGSRGPRPVDVDGDGRPDPVTLQGRTLSVDLSRSDRVDRTELGGGGRVLALERLDQGAGAVAVVGAGRSRYLGIAVIGPRGFEDGQAGATLAQVLQGAALVADRVGPGRVDFSIE